MSPAATRAQCRTRRLAGIVQSGLSSPGRGLEPPVRRTMEAAFGRDFSGVRVHSDVAAAASSDALGARAWTLGSHIVLGTSAPPPSSVAGRGLLAHELAHVTQQSARPAGALQLGPRGDRAEVEAARSATAVAGGSSPARLSPQPAGVVRRDPQPGSSVHEEHVETITTNTNQPGITSGTVRRDEFGAGHTLIQSMTARVRFDANACRVTVPVKVAYRQPTASDISQWESIKGNSRVSRTQPGLGAGQGRDVFLRYISTANKWLNDWYTLRLDGCTGTPCSGRSIPIQVEISEDTANPDYTVAVVNSAGRASVSSSLNQVVLSGDPGTGTLAHEAAHMALGHGDEYSEKGRPVEREHQGDYSLLADDSGGWSVLHERHFAFVPVFVAKALGGPPSCRPRLEEIKRPMVDFSVFGSAGAFLGSRSPGMYAGVGLDIGVRPTNRAVRASVGPHLTATAPVDYRARSAYMLGVRAGLEYNAPIGSLKLPVGLEAEVGDAIHGGGAYVEGGVRAGVTAPAGPVVMKIFLEAAAGTSINPHDPESQHWFRAGLGIGVGF